jgi:hypothetical protein
VGDWDGNGSQTPGIVRIGGGTVLWALNNQRDSSAADLVFTYGVVGDIPITGDWDNNGTWTPGVRRGSTWYLRNSNTPGGAADITFVYGDNNDIPIPGRWKTQSASQPMTPAIVRLGPLGYEWHQRFSNTSGGADRVITYGDARTDRPMAGDWTSLDGSTHFGPGIVRDIPPDPCTSPNPTQQWHLRYTNTSGGANVSFGYELHRP